MTTTIKPIGADPFTLSPNVSVIVAGYTGRDEAQVRHHIDELAAIGVPPPPQVPMVYPMPTDLLTTTASVTVTGDNTSGEVEPVYLRHDGQWYLGVGSDHTDRSLETVDIGRSKVACPKPVGEQVAPIADWATFDFDTCTASSTVDGATYQRGSLAGLRRPGELLRILVDRDAGLANGDLVVFGGTLPLLDGKFVPGSAWAVSIALPDGTRLSHDYCVKTKN